MRGLRFQRRIRLPGGLRLNLSKSGIGLSAGVPGLRAGIDAKGRKYMSTGLPGTGLSARKYFNHGRITQDSPEHMYISPEIRLATAHRNLERLPGEAQGIRKAIEKWTAQAQNSKRLMDLEGQTPAMRKFWKNDSALLEERANNLSAALERTVQLIEEEKQNVTALENEIQLRQMQASESARKRQRIIWFVLLLFFLLMFGLLSVSTR